MGGVLFLTFPAAASAASPTCLAGCGCSSSSTLILTFGECSTIGDCKMEPEKN